MKRASLLVGLLLGLLLVPSVAGAWWSDDWALRRTVTIDAGAIGSADAVGRFPLLIRLHDGVFSFTNVLENGDDIRVIPADDNTPLAYHLEKLDPLLGIGLLWVDVPDLKPGTSTDIFLYYANKKAKSAADRAGTYDPATTLVYHFGDGAAPPRDSTAFGNTALTAGTPNDSGIIGDALRFDGTTPVSLPATPSLAVTAGSSLTLSMWLNMDRVQPAAILYERLDGAGGLTLGLDAGTPFVQVANGGEVQRATADQALPTGGWHHVAVTADAAGLILYVDGVQKAAIAAALPALTTAATLGGHATPAAAATPAPGVSPRALATAPAAPLPAAGFAGQIDEVQMANVARSAAFIRAAAVSQGAGSTVVTIAAGEETSSWFTGYFAILIQSVTIDGWVVIAILMVMAVWSWVIMATKTAYLGRQNRANTLFHRIFATIANDLGALASGSLDDLLTGRGVAAGDRRLLRQSSLFRLLQLGAADIHGRFAAPETPAVPAGDRAPAPSTIGRILDPLAISALRARLDGGIVREGQELNRSMVMLTIAISGGPFLGLLGTVVGVMITFAAIAAAGDVNVNAIAPGIAAALVATVAGLFVAIPALFAYNYFTIRIRDINADMRVFSDEFITRIAEVYRRRDHLGETRIAAE